MVVRKHGPESPQGNSRKMYAQLRKITFQVGTDKGFAPLPAGGKAPGKQRTGKTMKIRIYKPIFHAKYNCNGDANVTPSEFTSAINVFMGNRRVSMHLVLLRRQRHPGVLIPRSSMSSWGDDVP